MRTARSIQRQRGALARCGKPLVDGDEGGMIRKRKKKKPEVVWKEAEIYFSGSWGKLEISSGP